MIIDAHVHLYLGDTALDDLLAACDQAGIDKVCLSACGRAFNEPENEAVRAAFEQHPDHHIFASLPGAGEFLAPALLSKFHDCRARFPHAAVTQATAGTSPVTIQSGKKRHVRFRRACDKEFRYYATQFARSSVRESPWAAAYFQTVRPRCDKASHAYRCLANRWIAIIWRLWMDRVTYDETVHLRNRHTGQQPR